MFWITDPSCDRYRADLNKKGNNRSIGGKEMKISYVLAALVAMLCLAGFASASTPVTGSVSSDYTADYPTSVNFGAMSPLSPGSATLTVTGYTNFGLTASAASAGLGLHQAMLIDGAVSPSPYKAVTISAADGSYTVSFALSQVVEWTDATGPKTGSITVTFA